MPARNSKGRFVKGHKGGRRRSHRRANPGAALPILLANPRRRHATKRRRTAGRVVVVSNPRENPRRRRHVRRHRRGNPILSGGIMHAVKLGVAGGVGILVARVVRYWVGKIAPGGTIGEILKIVASAGSAWALGYVGKTVGLAHDTSGAMTIGAGAETVRGALGLGVRMLGVSDPDRFGLGALPAPTGPAPFAVDDAGQLYQLNESGEYVATGMAGLVEEEAFAGLVEEEAFA